MSDTDWQLGSSGFWRFQSDFSGILFVKDFDVSLKLSFSVHKREIFEKPTFAVRTRFGVGTSFVMGIIGFWQDM